MTGSDPNQQALVELLRGERRRSNVLLVACLLLGACAVALVWRLTERSVPVTDGTEAAATAELVAELRLELEQARAALQDRKEPPAGETAPADALAPQTTAPTIDLTGRPDPVRGGGAAEPTVDRPWEESVARALSLGERIRQDLGATAKDAVTDAASVTDQGQDAEADGSAEEATPEQGEALSALLFQQMNQFLVDAGLSRYRLVEAQERPTEAGLFQVLLAMRPEASNAGGTVHAERMWLEVHPISRQAQWILQGAHGTSGGVRIEYPHRVLTIDVPGVVPPDLVPEALAELLGLTGTRALPSQEVDTPRLTERFNRRLAEENLPARVVRIGREEGGVLWDVAVDLGRLPGDERREEVRAERAWWELDASRAVLTLVCEGGEIQVGKEARPFFRGTWRRSYGNIHPEAWRALPAVLSSGSAPD